MPGEEMEKVMAIRRMSFEEKLELLSDADKDYLRGYIDRALVAQAQKKASAAKSRSGEHAKNKPE